MNPGTSNTTTPGGNSVIPTSSSEEIITNPERAVGAGTGGVGALRAALSNIQTAEMDAQRASTPRLDEVIKKEKNKEKSIKESKIDENNDFATGTPTTRWVLAGVLVPTPPVAYHTSPGPTNSTSSPITHGNTVAIDEVTEAPWARTPRDASLGPQGRSMRTTGSAQNPEQDELVGISTAPEGGATTDAPVKKTVEGLSSQIAQNTMAKAGIRKRKEGLAKAVTKTEPPVLRPRGSAGVTKTLPRCLKGKTAAKAKAEVVEEAENKGITTTKTIDKVAKAPRTRAPRGAPQSLQRRSVRIIESTLKSVQDRLAVAPTVQGEGETTTGAVLKNAIERLGGRIAPRTKAKVGMGKGKEQPAQVAIKAKSQVLKTTAGLGVMRGTAVGGFEHGIVAKAGDEMEKERENYSVATTTTAEKGTKTSRARPPREAPQAPRRRSLRLVESQKSALREQGGQVVAAPVKKTVRWLSGQIELKTKDKVRMDKGKVGHAKTVVKAKSWVTGRRAGAGVTKKGGRGGSRGGRSGKTRGSKKA